MQVTCNKLQTVVMNIRQVRALGIALLPILLLGGLFAFAYHRSAGVQRLFQSSIRANVVVTIYPLADLAKQVGGDLVNVTTVVPAGVEPHEYEPTPQDIAKLYKAEVVILNGNGMDVWADRLMDDLRQKGVRVIRMSDEIPSIGTDPHFWLDPVLAKQAVDLISRPLFLTLHDPETLDRQIEATNARLDTLDQQYRASLANCRQREFVTSHDAFAYLAKRYTLTQRPISGFSPTDDPSPQTIAELTNLVTQKGITTIFFETLVSPKLAQTIAAETGAKTATLNPIEGLTSEDQKAGKSYMTLMQDNLLELTAALQCS